MAKTFSIELWEQLKTDLNESGEDNKVFFDQAPSSKSVPYYVVHMLDVGEDPASRTYCKIDGKASVQINVYCNNSMQLDELLSELNGLMASYRLFPNFRINSMVRSITKASADFESSISAGGFTRFNIKYEDR